MYEDEAFLKLKLQPVTQTPIVVSGASVNNGIIIGGINNMEPLYLSEK